MGEIDTKPIESVQAALSFFEHSNEERRFHSPPNDQQQEVDKEREIESLERELANAKLQLEAKEAAHKQALLKVDHYQKTADELSTLLKASDLKKNFYINESKDATSRATELESALTRQLSESGKAHEQLLHAKNELESTQQEISLLREAKMESVSQMERLQKEVSEMNEAMRAHAAALSEKEAELESALSEAKQMMKKLETLSDLENQLVELSSQVEQAKELQTEFEKTKEQENEAQIEIALLKFQLHKERSKMAAAEAAEARAQSEKTALYNALQQMGLEAEETKKENRMLKEALTLADQSAKNEEEREVHDDHGRVREVEDMKRELEAAMAKMGELRMRAEQAISRAEAAEKAKAALEEQNKKRRESKERRKAAYAALREESMERESFDDSETSAKSSSYQPLGKVLNMKF